MQLHNYYDELNYKLMSSRVITQIRELALKIKALDKNSAEAEHLADQKRMLTILRNRLSE